ncbi:hypothetical protein [Streptomyces sp. bgisy032]|uniref:hypothetical protein n=1 Tax=Streptomyces sp. bgisy032 TaxID=3413773 RepID=UPI003D72D4BA
MIRKVAHARTGTGPAETGLALAVAHALHPPASRAPEVAAPAARRAARATAARRRTARG